MARWPPSTPSITGSKGTCGEGRNCVLPEGFMGTYPFYLAIVSSWMSEEGVN